MTDSKMTDEQEDAAIAEAIGDGCCGGGVGPIPYPLCECPRSETTRDRWYVMKTLVGCAPGSDVNRRILYHNDRPVVTFNDRMAEWHPDDNKALSDLAAYLNGLGEEAIRAGR